jgi:hypothetical protein
LATAAALILLVSGEAVFAQQPAPEQTSAIRASCRSDFMANCSGVQPGGRDALECLQRNLAKLSPACKTAVSAITPAPAAPPAAAPAAAAPAQPTAPAAGPAQTSAPPPTPPEPAKPATTAKPKPVPAAKANPSPAPPPVAAAPAAPAVPPLVLRPMLPQRRTIIMAICRGDAVRLCPDLPPIGPAVLDCLAVKASSLSPTCYEALARVSRP